MSSGPLSVGRRFSVALAEGKLEAVLALADPEIALCTPRGTLRGHDGVRRLLATPPLEHLERQIHIDEVVGAAEHPSASSNQH